MDFVIYVVIALVVLALIILIANIKIVPQANAYVVERLGAYKSTWGTGIHWKVPFVERIAKKVSLKEQVVDFPPQPVITKDNVTMQIDTVIYYQITDAKLYAYGVERPLSAIENLSATTLRNIIGEMAVSYTHLIPDTHIIPNVDLVCGRVGFAPYAIPGSKELGDKIASVFEEGYNVVMLENHGVVVGSENIFKAFMAFETLESCARLEINANRIGAVHSLTDKHLRMSQLKENTCRELDEFIPNRHYADENNSRREMVEFIHRSYDQRLFNSTEGTFSVRLNDNSFLITPYMKDRKYLQVEDIVRIDGEQREAGKTPSRSVMLHKNIYDKHPEINSVIIAHAPHIMAFAVTDREFDSRTIPESYIQLRTVSKVSLISPVSLSMEPNICV